MFKSIVNVILFFCRSLAFLAWGLISSIVFHAFFAALIVAVIISMPLVCGIVICAEAVMKYLEYLDRLKYRIGEYRGEKRTHHVKQVMKKYLQIECSHNSDIPPHLVNAFLHLSSLKVYEIERKSGTVSRTFQFDNRKNRIEVTSSFRNRTKIWTNLITDLEDDSKFYTNYLPDGVLDLED